MPENIIDRFGQPEIQESELRFDTPKNTRKVELPLVYANWLAPIPGTKQVSLGLHEDMLQALAKAIGSLKPKTRNRLLIEGRYITEKQWRKLRLSDTYRFFWEGRAYRGDEENQQDVIKMTMPKDTELSDEEMKKLAFMRCTVQTLAEEVGYRTAYFPAEMIMELGKNDGAYDLNGPNSLRGILGAVNEFKIGSDELSPGLLRFVESRILTRFSNAAAILVGLNQPVWKNRTLSAMLRIVDTVAPENELFFRNDAPEEKAEGKDKDRE